MMSSPGKESSSSLQTSLSEASSSWSKFNLSTKKQSLLENTTTTKQYRDASQAARKSLADATKAFKKVVKSAEVTILSDDVVTVTATTTTIATDGGTGTDGDNNNQSNNQSNNSNNVSKATQSATMENLSKECRTIVNLFKSEIDELTRRCKYADTLYLDLSKSLVELPDPTELLSNSESHLNSQKSQIDHLLSGMKEMQVEMEKRETEQSVSNSTLESKLSSLQSELETTRTQLTQLSSVHESLKKQQKQQTEVLQSQKENSINNMMSTQDKLELIELRKEVKEYEVEFKALKNQDITIKKLNAKIEELVSEQESVLERELKKAQEHLAATEGRRATEALEREAQMAQKLSSIELLLKAERAGRSAQDASLLEKDEGLNEREAAWDATKEILILDGERLREELFECQREKEDLLMQLSTGGGATINTSSASGSGSGSGSASGNGNGNNKDEKGVSMSVVEDVERKAYEAEVGELTMTVTSLREELNTKDDTIGNLQRSMQDTIESLEHERTYLSKKVSTLETQVADAPSKEKITSMKRELRILKKLEYNASEDKAEGSDDDDDNDNNTTFMDNEDLESVLIGKLRKLEMDLVKERRDKNNYQEECTQLQNQRQELEQSKADALALAARLEIDLEKAITVPTQGSTSFSSSVKKGLDVTVAPSDSSTLQRILDPSSSFDKTSTSTETSTTVVEAVPVNATTTTTTQSNSTMDKMNDDHSVATIVMAQRDRLRARCDALEAERDSFKRELQVQVSTAESLKTDNTKLYEKVRYLQNYNTTNNNLVISGDALSRRNKMTLADRDLDLEALEQRYEASVDPFRQFSRTERQRKMKEMSPMERTVFMVARTVLASKEMRTVLFFYVLGMHLLVFITTYHWSHGCHNLPHPVDVDHFHGGVPHPEVHEVSGAIANMSSPEEVKP